MEEKERVYPPGHQFPENIDASECEIYSPPTASQDDAISVPSNDDSSENQWQDEDIENSIITNIEVASSVKQKKG